MMSLVTAKCISLTRRKLLCYRVNNLDSLINTVGKKPETIYDAYVMTRNAMRDKNKYNLFEKSFKQRMFWDFTTTLDRISDKDIYNKFYNAIKNKYIYDCEIDGQSLDYFMDLRLCEMYVNLRMREAEDFRKMFGLNFKDCPCVVIYGAGSEGRLAWHRLHIFRSFKIVGWIDKNAEKLAANDVCVDSIEKLKDIIYDYIYIAIRNRDIRASAIDELIKFGVKREFII